mmetsp:Transcript_5667/g.16417  ORF Transcript_5667/g.16417 Transcript_5667/m.16417 type:complete len:269 (-) Transcript_5667:157-963(-)
MIMGCWIGRRCDPFWSTTSVLPPLAQTASLTCWTLKGMARSSARSSGGAWSPTSSAPMTLPAQRCPSSGATGTRRRSRPRGTRRCVGSGTSSEPSSSRRATGPPARSSWPWTRTTARTWTATRSASSSSATSVMDSPRLTASSTSWTPTAAALSRAGTSHSAWRPTSRAPSGRPARWSPSGSRCRPASSSRPPPRPPRAGRARTVRPSRRAGGCSGKPRCQLTRRCLSKTASAAPDVLRMSKAFPQPGQARRWARQMGGGSGGSRGWS